MKFKITKIEDDEISKKYTCEFIKGEEKKDFFTFIGLPEINSPKSVLQILASSCDAAFGGDGGISCKDDRFSDETEVKTDYGYEVC